MRAWYYQREQGANALLFEAPEPWGTRLHYSLDRLFLIWTSLYMAWEVEFTGQFET